MWNAFLLPALALVGGAGGFLLRRWELATAFEATGLATPGATASVLLIALSAMLAAAFILLCRRPKTVPTEYGAAFSARKNWAYLAVMALAAACLLLAALVGWKAELTAWPRSVLHLLLWALCIVSFFGVLRIALNHFRGTMCKYSTVLLIPGYTFCLWLVSAYQQHAADPVTLAYVYELLAIICTLLGIYFTAAFSFAKGKFRLCALFSLLGIYFSVVTLADSHDHPTQLLYLFAILYQLAHATILLKNAYTAVPKTLSDDTNHTQEVIPDEQ